MRLYFELSPNTEPVPFDYQHFLIGAFHKWLGKNELHDVVSLYSLSWLSLGERKRDVLDFPKGARWFISFFDANLCKQILKAAIGDAEVCCGMKVTDIQIRETPQFRETCRFVVATPILVRSFDGKQVKHLTYRDVEADKYLTATLQKKLSIAGLSDPTAQVRFDQNYSNPKTKLVSIKGIQNKASLCPVIVKGTIETVSFAWDVGIGHSTGSGFGALC